MAVLNVLGAAQSKLYFLRPLLVVILTVLRTHQNRIDRV